MGIITHATGDLLNQTNIAHGCNAQGVMGSGVAKVIKERYPGAYEQYRNGVMGMEDCLGTSTYYMSDNGVVVNMVVQENYGRDNKRYVSYDAVSQCFAEAAHLLRNTTLNIPRIGAGLGGGNWNIIEQIIVDEIKNFPLNVVVWTL